MSVRIARLLWVVWAVLAWNVLFDHVIVVAGRGYIAAADRAAAAVDARQPRSGFENMDAWMRPALGRAFWTASAAAGAILLSGAVLIRRGEGRR
jgi:hypothetical protein